MPSYRCLFLDSADRVAEARLINCDTEGEVPAHADKLLGDSGYPGIEVWERYRKVYRSRKSR